MKYFFTNKLFILLLLLSVSLVSCKDKGEEEAAPVNSAACKLTRTEITEPGSAEKTVLVAEYNAQGYVVRLTETAYRDGAVNDVDVSAFEYNANNQLIKVIDLEDGETDGYDTYEYNANGTLSKISYFDYDGTLRSYETFNYDANKRLIERLQHYSYNNSTYKIGYEYGSNDNIARMIVYDLENKPLYVTTYENYDDKLNPLYAIKGIVLVGESKHNPGKANDVYDNNGDGVLDASDTPEVTTYTYKYNAHGYATEIVEKYNGVEDEKTTFTFEGCN